MNRNDIKFPHDTTDAFLVQCMNNAFSANQAIVDACAAEANSVDEFIYLYISRKEESASQFYGELLKRERPDLVFYAIREKFGDRQFKTMSDAGSVKIGNDSFSILIPNGRGDGTTRVAIFEKAEFTLENLMMFFASFRTSKAFVYNYDCSGGEPIAEISGNFSVFYGNGFVALVKERECED